jgi:hypothetical protein
MNGRRSRWIRKLFIVMDPGLILSLNKIYGDEVKKVNPRSLYNHAKKMWNQHNPATKTWGKGISMNFEKTKTEGVIDNG